MWDTRANNHNSMFDKRVALWLAATVRGMDNPDLVQEGLQINPYAQRFSRSKEVRVRWQCSIRRR